MKLHVISNLSYALCLCLLLSACSSDDDPIGVDAGSGTLTAKIDGTSFTSKPSADGAVFASSQGTNNIQGFSEDGQFIGFTIFGSLSSGMTLNIDSSGVLQALYKPEFMDQEQYQAIATLGSGSMTITNFSSSNISGTFRFNGIKANPDGTLEEIVITEGSYDIDY